MSKKFFSLLHGDKINAAPGTKIIPAESFSTLLEASDVLEQIQKDVDQYRLEVAKECEQLKENAQKEGYDEGFKKWAEHLARLENEINLVHKEIQQMIIPVALKAAKKIVGREVELSEDIIVDIVASNLKAVSQHKKVTIYVNRKELDVLEQNRPRLRELFESLESLAIRERNDIAPGGCVIETEVGIINAQMDHRWYILEKAFESLLKTQET